MTATLTTRPAIQVQTPRLHGTCAILAPVLLLASTVAFLSFGGTVNDGVVGGTISAWSAFCFVVAFVGIARAFETVAPRGSVVLLCSAVAGFLTGLSYSVLAIDLGATGASFMTVEPQGWDAFGQLAFDPWGLCIPLAYLVTAFLVWRTRLFPRWVIVPLLAGGIGFVPSRELGIPMLAVLTDVVLVVALAPIGAALFGSRRGSAA